MRTELTALQGKYRELGMERTQVSTLMLHQAGRLAVQYGMPELLEFAMQEDSNGKIRLTDNPELQAKYMTLKNQAESRRDSRLASMATNQKKAVEESDAQYTSGMIAQVHTLDPTDKEGAAELLVELLQFGPDGRMNLSRLPIGQQQGMVQLLDDSRRSLFATQSDDAMYIRLQEQHLAGELTFAGLVNAVPHITREDYQKLFSFIDSATGKTNSAKTTVWRDLRSNFRTFLSKKLDPKDEYGINSLYQDGPSNLEMAVREMDQAVWEYVDKNNGALPDRETANEIFSAVEEKYKNYFYSKPQVFDGKLPSAERLLRPVNEKTTKKKTRVVVNPDGSFQEETEGEDEGAEQ